jgi:hypothetical protein
VKKAVIDSFALSNRTAMRSRTGLEAEAINRLTDGVQPPVLRAILVQCLAGEVAPSAAISRMFAEGAPHAVRAAIDDVTHRAATISRASDMLVHDRVDELTQIFVENAAALADIGDATKILPGEGSSRPGQMPPPRDEGQSDETRISG